jgi:dihydrodipicolinate synthase/N-acetylneuraminate lyase
MMCLFHTVNPAKFLTLAKDRIPNLVGLKHSSKELNNAYNCTLVDPDRFQVLMGTDAVSFHTIHTARLLRILKYLL